MSLQPSDYSVEEEPAPTTPTISYSPTITKRNAPTSLSNDPYSSSSSSHVRYLPFARTPNPSTYFTMLTDYLNIAGTLFLFLFLGMQIRFINSLPIKMDKDEENIFLASSVISTIAVFIWVFYWWMISDKEGWKIKIIKDSDYITYFEYKQEKERQLQYTANILNTNNNNNNITILSIIYSSPILKLLLKCIIIAIIFISAFNIFKDIPFTYRLVLILSTYFIIIVFLFSFFNTSPVNSITIMTLPVLLVYYIYTSNIIPVVDINLISQLDISLYTIFSVLLHYLLCTFIIYTILRLLFSIYMEDTTFTHNAITNTIIYILLFLHSFYFFYYGSFPFPPHNSIPILCGISYVLLYSVSIVESIMVLISCYIEYKENEYYVGSGSSSINIVGMVNSDKEYIMSNGSNNNSNNNGIMTLEGEDEDSLAPEFNWIINLGESYLTFVLYITLPYLLVLSTSIQNVLINVITSTILIAIILYILYTRGKIALHKMKMWISREGRSRLNNMANRQTLLRDHV